MGARNPKEARISLYVTQEVSDRVERLADAAQGNKGTIATLTLVAGLNLLERVYLVDVEKYADQAAAEKLAQMAQDLKSVVPGPN